jgi:hypothetical protein
MGFNQPTVSSVNSYKDGIDDLPTNAAPFVGSAEYVGHFNGVMAAVKCDVAGTLYMEFTGHSDDLASGGSADSSLSYLIPAGINQVHRLSVTRPFYRVRFVPDSAAATFDLWTTYGSHALLATPLNLSLNQYADAILTRNVGFDFDVAAGRFGGISNFAKFGSNTDIDTAGNEDIWEGGGIYAGFPTGAAETVDVFSTSSYDDEGGAGAEIVRLFGLDENWEEQTEDITLNGLEANRVTSVNSWRRVNRMTVIQSNNGANDTFNVGVITCRHTTTTANVFAGLPVGTNQTKICAFTVPAGKGLVLESLNTTILKSSTADITGALWVREFGLPPKLLREFSATEVSPHVDIRQDKGLMLLPEKTDFSLRIITCNANNTKVFGLMSGTLFSTL